MLLDNDFYRLAPFDHFTIRQPPVWEKDQFGINLINASVFSHASPQIHRSAISVEKFQPI